MGHHALRKDMTCLNCNHVVEKRYCPNCGQENTETKESFHYLFTHTIEDLVHYDSGFWKTIKFLLFYPAKLTTEYLSGKRKTYVAPVKLYIFISFITFFILSIINSFEEHKETPLKNTNTQEEIIKEDNIRLSESKGNVIKLDSTEIQSKLGKENNQTVKWLFSKFRDFEKNSKQKDFNKKFSKTFFSTIPKALFIFMPLFAFVLWLFHDKKKWYYFDHGIFTIHYFSMILLSFTINEIITLVLDYMFKGEIADTINGFIALFLILWWVFYFFRSHSRFYGEKKWISRIKGTFILGINTVFLIITILILVTYSALNVN